MAEWGCCGSEGTGKEVIRKYLYQLRSSGTLPTRITQLTFLSQTKVKVFKFQRSNHFKNLFWDCQQRGWPNPSWIIHLLFFADVSRKDTWTSLPCLTIFKSRRRSAASSMRSSRERRPSRPYPTNPSWTTSGIPTKITTGMKASKCITELSLD